jgi:hypothetical protein
MNCRTALMWSLRNFLRILILTIVVSFFVFRATELMMTLNTASYIETYYIAGGLELPDAFRRISGQEQTWRILHLVLSFVLLVATLFIIYAFTLIRRENNGNLLQPEKHPLRLIAIRELAILLSISAPATIIGTLFSTAFLDNPQSFHIRLFQSAQMLTTGLPLPEFWFLWMFFASLVTAIIVGVFVVKRLV